MLDRKDDTHDGGDATEQRILDMGRALFDDTATTTTTDDASSASKRQKSSSLAADSKTAAAVAFAAHPYGVRRRDILVGTRIRGI